MKAAVLTSTIGRPELRQCIESVLSQTMPATHYVVSNGPPWHDKVREIVKDYPTVRPYYLYEETGNCGVGPGAGGVFSALPFLTDAEVIYYLNDDDYYDTNHVESLYNLITLNDLGWAYTLRRFVDKDKNIICEDNFESLGFWRCINDQFNGQDIRSYLVDNSCYALRNKVARQTSPAWLNTEGSVWCNDRVVLNLLKSLPYDAGVTGLSTVNYRCGTGASSYSENYFKINIEAARLTFPGGFPWRQPTLFRRKKDA